MTEPIMRVQARLTDRDLLLLGWLADHDLLTSFQIADALYPSRNFTQRRLRSLLSYRLVDRFRPQRPDGGSYPYHYLLAQLGTEVVATQRGEELPRRDQARRRRWQLTNRTNLAHLLGVNDFFTQLAGHARRHPQAALHRWWSARRCQTRGALAEAAITHPTGRADFPADLADWFDSDAFDPAAAAYLPRVRPDGHGVWTDHVWTDHDRTGRERTVAFFLEHDTGTEPLHRLVDKVRGYQDLAQVIGHRWPVLFWLHSPTRQRHLHLKLTAAGIDYPVATAARDHPGHPDAAGPPHPAEAVWSLHRHHGPLLRLADLGAPAADRSAADQQAAVQQAAAQ